MRTTTEAPLPDAGRCLLALPSVRAPLLAPMAYWYDGEAVWTTTAADTVEARLPRRDGGCAVYVPPRPARVRGAPAGGVVARGQARVLSLDDPVGLALRAPVIIGALAGLALASPATLLGYARDAARVPARWAPRNRVVLRVAVEGLTGVPAAEPPPGVAPPLPPVVPADVRRALAGVRRVVVARAEPGGVDILPGWWDASFALARSPGGEPVEDGTVAVAVDGAGRESPLGACGLVLYGRVAGGALRPERVTWWRGLDLETADVPPARPGVVLPD